MFHKHGWTSSKAHFKYQTWYPNNDIYPIQRRISALSKCIYVISLLNLFVLTILSFSGFEYYDFICMSKKYSLCIHALIYWTLFVFNQILLQTWFNILYCSLWIPSNFLILTFLVLVIPQHVDIICVIP